MQLPRGRQNDYGPRSMRPVVSHPNVPAASDDTMARLPPKGKSRKVTAEDLAAAARAQAELAPPSHGPVNEERIVDLAQSKWLQYDPEFLEIEGIHYSVKELAEAVRAQKKKKRRQGRPTIPNKFAILDAAALAKVRDGRYTQIAAKWKLTPRQLSNLVERNRPYFDGKVKSLLKNIGIKE
jgi:hypothetical protein